MRYAAQSIAFTGLNLFRHQPQIRPHLFAALEALRLIDYSHQRFAAAGSDSRYGPQQLHPLIGRAQLIKFLFHLTDWFGQRF